MDEVPPPWQELLEIFNIAPNPIESARFWFNEARHSRLYSSPADLDHFLLFIALPVPFADRKHNLVVRPKLSEFTSEVRDLTIRFLLNNHEFVSNRCVQLVFARAERHFRFADDRRMFMTLNSKRSVADFDDEKSSPLDGAKVSIKRLRDDDKSESPPLKRTKIDDFDPVSETSVAHVEQLCDAIRHDDVDLMFSSLKSLSVSSLESACEAMLHGHVIDEGFMTKALTRMLETTSGDLLIVERFVKYPCVVFLKQMKKNLSREFTQRLIELCKGKSSLVSNNLFVSFIEQLRELSAVQANLISSMSKQVMSASDQLQLLRSVARNRNLLESSFDQVISLYLVFLSAPVQLEDEDQACLCQFFKFHSLSASKCFNFAKLLLTFLKKHGRGLSSVNYELLSDVVESNLTALRPACKAALSKCK